MHDGKPVVLVCGDGGCGKDTVSKLIADNWFIPYKHSTSWQAACMMWPEVRAGKTEFTGGFFKDFNDFYSQRSRFRKFWAEWIDRYNLRHSTADGNCIQLYRDCLSAGNRVLNGVRRANELAGLRRAAIADLVIWVERPGNPRDPTQEFGPESCDWTIINDTNTHLNAADRLIKMFRFTRAIHRIHYG